MRDYRIIDRGDGPKIEGTRITVYTVFEYLEKGRSREWIASMLDLSSRQVQAAVDYINQHRAEVEAQFMKIVERIERGNAPWVEQKLKVARERLQRRLAAKQQESVSRGENHGR